MLPARQNSSSSAGANCKLQKSAKGESKARRRRQTCAAHHAGGGARGSPRRPRLPAGCSKSRQSEIGRASCRERGENSVVGVSLKKKKEGGECEGPSLEAK